MAAKKTAKGSKSAFVRKHPDLAPAEVEAKAKEAGLEVSAAYVSNVRSADKAGGPKKAKKGGRPTKATAPTRATPPKGKPGPKPNDGSISKSEFIRSLPATLSAKEAVAKAKAEGISITETYVYAIRSASKKGSAKRAKTAAPTAATATMKVSGHNDAAVKRVVQLVLDSAGYSGARALLAEVGRRIDQIA